VHPEKFLRIGPDIGGAILRGIELAPLSEDEKKMKMKLIGELVFSSVHLL